MHPPPQPISTPLIFTLPLEIRQQIYALLLPSTTTLTADLSTSSLFPSLRSPYPSEHFSTDFLKKSFPPPRPRKPADHGIVWRRGCTALLAVNHQMHEETAEQMYGTNTFVIDVSYDCIKFNYRWIVPASNLVPTRDVRFLEHFSVRNLQRIRNYVVFVEQVDSYTGMVKYNCGGAGLPAGLEKQVSELVAVMRSASGASLHRLKVHLTESSREQRGWRPIHAAIKAPQHVLDPFKTLRHVRTPIITGSVTLAYAEELQQAMHG